jgi:hypothetical protein
VAALVAGVMTGAIDSLAQGVSDCIDFDSVTPCNGI